MNLEVKVTNKVVIEVEGEVKSVINTPHYKVCFDRDIYIEPREMIIFQAGIKNVEGFLDFEPVTIDLISKVTRRIKYILEVMYRDGSLLLGEPKSGESFLVVKGKDHFDLL